MTTKNTLDEFKAHFRAEEKELLDEFFTFLRFPTISADKSKREVLQSCARWLEVILSESGFEVELWNHNDAPIVFAQDLHAGPHKPTLLIYNHYDVQPVDPIELWHHDPFSPVKEGSQITARGAQDNKGQCFYVMTALRHILKYKKQFPINIKWIIEGEEESGSHSLSRLVEEKKKKLSCDSLFIVDLGMHKPHLPAITLGTRGLISLEVEITSTKSDLHSGMHGGLAYNPIHALVELLTKLRGEDGRILVPGFYDELAPIDEEEMKRMDLSFDIEEYKEHFGAAPTGGEKSFTPRERVWLRPTLEINGISGGYQGPGGKTVIPAKASAKITCRLVPNQNPPHIASLVKSYIESLAPRGVEVQVQIHEGMGKPVRCNRQAPLCKALEEALTEVFWHKPEYIFEGASIPVVEALREATGSEVAMWGLGLASDKIHAPNENFSWDRIEKGYLTMVETIYKYGQMA